MARFANFRRMGKPVTAAAAALLLSVTAAACGASSSSAISSTSSVSSSSSSTSPDGTQTVGSGDASASGVAYANARIAKYSSMHTTFTPPGPALTPAQQALVKSGISGKTVWFIPIFQQAIQFSSETKSFTEAVEVFGGKVHVCDAQVNPSKASQCLLQAVSSGAAGIVTSSLSYSFAPKGFDAAIAAKIPLILADDDETGSASIPASPTSRQLSVNGSEFGRLGADIIIADSNGEANVIYAADDASAGAIQSAATQDEYASKCPKCTVTLIHYSDGSVSKLTTAASAALISHPNVNYFQNAYDEPGGIYAVQGLQQVKGRSVKFVAGGGSPVGLQRIQLGQQLASPGVDTSQIAWNMADSLFRFTAMSPQITDYPSAIRLFTSTNLPKDPTDASGFESGAWYSDGGFRAMYKTLWGTGPKS